jgi:anti-anti-sigma factor
MLGTYAASGEIDMETAPAFAIDLRECIENANETLVSVDCTGVTFMDSAGYHALLGATRHAARQGHTLVIRNLPPACARLIRMCNADGEIRVDRAPERAVRRGASVVAHDRDVAIVA